MNLVVTIVPNGVSMKNQNRTANSVDSDETAHYEPSHLDLHYLHRYPNRSTRLKGLTHLC